MNTIIENRVQQLVITKFLTTKNEITALSLLLKSIEKNIHALHGKSPAYDKQIENKQVFILNKIIEHFQNGSMFLSYFNEKTNNKKFNQLKSREAFAIVQSIEDSNSSDIMDVLNRASIKSTQRRTKNFSHSKKKRNTSKSVSNVDVIYKK